MRKIWISLAFTAACSPAFAHDFWLQPNRFSVAPNVATSLLILVGHGPFRSRWSGATDRVVVLRSYGPDGVVDQKPRLHPTADKDADLVFAKPGTYVLAFESTHALSNLPAIRFNDYAKVEGLTPALAQRERNHTTGDPGRESYSRRAKALIQVGDSRAKQPWITRPVGLSLEIVPDLNPYTLAPNAPLPVHVLYQGKPLAGALVKLTNLEFDVRPVAVHLTDAAGRAAFSFPRSGTWQMNVIWTQPTTTLPGADFDTTFSSLTFGYAATRVPGGAHR